MYKGLLSKLAAAKELQKEIFERVGKTAERLAKKEAATTPPRDRDESEMRDG